MGSAADRSSSWRRAGCPRPVPSRMTVYRVLVRHGLIEPGAAAPAPGGLPALAAGRRRWQLWQMDIVGGVLLWPTGREAKVVTGVDDHSRFCVIAAGGAPGDRPGGVPGVRRRRCAGSGCRRRCSPTTASSSPTGSARAGRCCSTGSAGTTASSTGSPSPPRRPRPGRSSGSTRPCAASCSTTPGRSPTWRRRRPRSTRGWPSTTPTGRTSRWTWPSRPTGSPPTHRPTSDERAAAAAALRRLAAAPARRSRRRQSTAAGRPSAGPADAGRRPASPGGPVEFDRVVPASGNLGVAGKQFWLGPARAGRHGHVLGRHRRHPPAHRRRPGQDRPLPPVRRRPGHPGRQRRPPRRPAAAAARRGRGAAVEVDRLVNAAGTVSLAGTAAAGRRDPRPAAGSASASSRPP